MQSDSNNNNNNSVSGSKRSHIEMASGDKGIFPAMHPVEKSVAVIPAGPKYILIGQSTKLKMVSSFLSFLFISTPNTLLLSLYFFLSLFRVFVSHAVYQQPKLMHHEPEVTCVSSTGNQERLKRELAKAEEVAETLHMERSNVSVYLFSINQLLQKMLAAYPAKFADYRVFAIMSNEESQFSNKHGMPCPKISIMLTCVNSARKDRSIVDIHLCSVPSGPWSKGIARLVVTAECPVLDLEKPLRMWVGSHDHLVIKSVYLVKFVLEGNLREYFDKMARAVGINCDPCKDSVMLRCESRIESDSDDE